MIGTVGRVMLTHSGAFVLGLDVSSFHSLIIHHLRKEYSGDPATT